MKKFIRKIIRVSTHSYSIVLPKEAVKDLNWRERQKLEITYDKKKKELRIKDWEK